MIRWVHGECDSIMSEEDAERCHVEGYSCLLCRPADVLPPHLAIQAALEKEAAAAAATALANKAPSPPPRSPDYPVYSGFYNNASYMMDGTMLSERGMQHLKSLTIEKDRVKRKRRLGPDMFNPLNPMDPNGGGGGDNSMEGDGSDEDDDKPSGPIIHHNHKVLLFENTLSL